MPLTTGARRASTCTRSAPGSPHGTSSIVVRTRSASRSRSRDRLRERGAAAVPARELDADRQRRLLLHAGRLRPDEDLPAHVRRERAHDLADRGREDVDAADDQHVVGAADAAHARAGAAARARARPHLDVVARAEAQQRRGAVAEMRQHELAGRAVLQLECAPRSRDRSARRGRSRARRGASRPAPRTRPRARCRCRRSPSPRSPSRPTPPPAARGRQARRRRARRRRARARRSSSRRSWSLGQVGRVGRCQHGRLRPQPLDRLHEPVGVARADGDVAEADPVEGGERRAGDERPGVVGRDDPLARR